MQTCNIIQGRYYVKYSCHNLHVAINSPSALLYRWRGLGYNFTLVTICVFINDILGYCNNLNDVQVFTLQWRHNERDGV